MHKIDDITGASILAAVPLFVFMEAMLEKSGTAERLFEAIHLWTQRLPGGLAVGTIAMCVIFAACSGVIGATETVLCIGKFFLVIYFEMNYILFSFIFS